MRLNARMTEAMPTTTGGTADRWRRRLAALRLVLGTAGYLAPGAVARAFGVDPDGNDALRSVVRMFAVREAALGLAVVAVEGPELTRWLALGAAVDAGDVITALLGRRSGRLSTYTTLAGTLLAGAAVAMGLASLRDGGRHGDPMPAEP